MGNKRLKDGDNAGKIEADKKRQEKIREIEMTDLYSRAKVVEKKLVKEGYNLKEIKRIAKLVKVIAKGRYEGDIASS